MQKIQSPYEPIKLHEEFDHHQLRNITLECTRWNLTTEILITPSFETIEPGIKYYWKLQFIYVLGFNQLGYVDQFLM